jgi:hypothetical protein
VHRLPPPRPSVPMVPSGPWLPPPSGAWLPARARARDAESRMFCNAPEMLAWERRMRAWSPRVSTVSAGSWNGARGEGGQEGGGG